LRATNTAVENLKPPGRGRQKPGARRVCYLRFSAFFAELSFELLSLEETSFDEPSREEPSFEELSDLDVSSFLESLPEPSAEDCEEDFFA
jgi:hypothetical protein